VRLTGEPASREWVPTPESALRGDDEVERGVDLHVGIATVEGGPRPVVARQLELELLDDDLGRPRLAGLEPQRGHPVRGPRPLLVRRETNDDTLCSFEPAGKLLCLARGDPGERARRDPRVLPLEDLFELRLPIGRAARA